MTALIVPLLGVLYRAGFADNIDFDGAGILHGRFDFIGYITSQLYGLKVVNLLWEDKHPNFAASADGVGFFYSREAGGGIFQVFHALDKTFGANVSRTRPRARYCIAN